MDIYLVFNELSAQDGCEQPDATPHLARQWMADLADVITVARRQGVLALKTYQNFFEIPLANNYAIRDWLQDREVDREQQRRIRSAGLAYPCLPPPFTPEDHAHLPDDIQEAETRSLEYEFTVEGGRTAGGLGSAYLLESIAVSLNTSGNWDQTEIAVSVSQMTDMGDIEQNEQIVKHISQVSHIPLHQNWIQDRFTTSVSDGEYLLTKCPQWYPDLVFIAQAETQLREMTAGTPQLRQAVKRLFDLENYCQTWVDGGFDKDKLASKASPESNSVRDNPKFRDKRMFLFPDGRSEFCEWHVRLTPDNWRLHFFPDAEQRKITICYIGTKLPTHRYPH